MLHRYLRSHTNVNTSLRHRFLNDGGAVAGVFVVVGLVVATIAAIVAFILCKRRRRRRIRLSISRPLPFPENPFEDPRASPSPSPTQMRYTHNSLHRNLVGAGIGASTEPVPHATRNLLDDEIEPIPAPVMSYTPSVRSGRSRRSERVEVSYAGIGAGGVSLGRPAYDGSPSYDSHSDEFHIFQPGHTHRPSDASGSSSTSSAGVGVALTSDTVQPPAPTQPPFTPRHRRRTSATPSAAPSTPSIYPATLPGGTEDETATESSHGPITPAVEQPASPLGLALGAVAGKPPVRPPRRRPVAPLPPRNPLRTAATADQAKLLVRTQVTPEDAQILDAAKPYEPITPPLSATSSNSDGGHSPMSMDVPLARPPLRPPVNPFADYNRYMAGKVDVAPPAEAKPRDNFYSRRVTPHVSAALGSS